MNLRLKYFLQLFTTWLAQCCQPLTLKAPTPQNGQRHSNNSLAVADEYFECVWLFYGVSTYRFNHFFLSTTTYIQHNFCDNLILGGKIIFEILIVLIMVEIARHQIQLFFIDFLTLQQLQRISDSFWKMATSISVLIY